VDHYTQNPVDPGVQFGEQSFMFLDSIGPTDRWAVFACTSPLSTSSRLRKNSIRSERSTTKLSCFHNPT
jgi:hypothetical protein